MKLYVILDRELLNGRDIIETAKELIDGGADLIQYRDKISSLNKIRNTAKRLSKLNLPLIINDYPEIAKAAGALGAHLGQRDMDIKPARRILRDKVIGRSTHNLEQALQAQSEGVDYIGIGPVFPTNTKKGAMPIGVGILKEISRNIDIPVFAIGGITLSNLDSILDAGISRVAVAGAILGTGNIKRTVEAWKRIYRN